MCKYTAKYYDYESKKLADYKCPHPPKVDGYCIFHAEYYWREHEDEVRNEFYALVEDAITNEKPLFCIGFNLPSFDLYALTEKGLKIEFKKPVYFRYARFQAEADFNKTIFSEADFNVAIFQVEADFSEAKFQVEADFRYATFQVADFRYATFQVADFSEATFQVADFIGAKFQAKAYFIEATFQAEADFRYAIFQAEADFRYAIFQAEADFIGAKFQAEADFRYAIFQAEADFRYAIFQAEADFIEAKFHYAYFSNADFKDEVEFIDTKFYPYLLRLNNKSKEYDISNLKELYRISKDAKVEQDSKTITIEDNSR